MDFNGCNVNIYNEEGECLANVKIADYNKQENTIEVPDLPDHINETCEVVILSAPQPYAYKGQIRRFGGVKLIAMYEGHNKEQRKETRYKADLPCMIEHLVFDERLYRLQTPLVLKITNISKTGMRLRGKTNDLIRGLCAKVRINVGNSDQILTADIVNSLHINDGIEEFGCALRTVSASSKQTVQPPAQPVPLQ